MVIIGKSGSGKSFATKTILANLAAEDSKVFILDPENEYHGIAKKMGGKVIDVGSDRTGRLNPFHITPSIAEEDEEETGISSSYAAHLQFLEEFFRQILPDLGANEMEILNGAINQTYESRGINASVNLASLAPSDFPTFDDLYDKLLISFQTSQSDFRKDNLRVLLTHIGKFAGEGRNAMLWNGEATISTNENFVIFNFQSLLANKNNMVANAQMLLVLKWLDSEIIKNRDYNLRYSANRKIIVVIDEAHVFIDTKYPIALDFMFQLAKRIRKYNGMQVVITQNIKDFVGSEEIARKSTAIINASQYSFIFALSPNDMHDLCKLYEKAGAINESEQEEIINNGRGQAFVVTSPGQRTRVRIVASKELQELF
jgi:type IV secretory pathway VirB4 component